MEDDVEVLLEAAAEVLLLDLLVAALTKKWTAALTLSWWRRPGGQRDVACSAARRCGSAFVSKG